jgi:hypothetical protein
MVADCIAATGTLETGTVTEAVPAGTVTVAGTTTAVLLADSTTEAPPTGASPDNVIVQVLLEPPSTDAGAHCRLESTGGVTVTAAVRDPPP